MFLVCKIISMFQIFFLILFAKCDQISASNLRRAWVDHEILKNASQVIQDKGYIANEYVTKTEDGYYLTLQRICLKSKYPRVKRKPVLLQHGLLESSHTWINNLANQSLGFILADAGYDVWLANSRGNIYSKRHEHMLSSNKSFWDFSWDEMAQYDLPAMIEFILEITGEAKLFYVGHSQGTQIAFARLGSDPLLRSKIAAFAALAPVAFLSNMQSPLRYVARLGTTVQFVSSVFGIGEFSPPSWLTKWLGSLLRKSSPLVCKHFLFIIAGYNKKNMDQTRIPVYFTHSSAGTSVQNMVHYSQSIIHGRFQAFDHGKLKNKKIYGQLTPPQYDLANLHLPTRLYWGGKDVLTTPTDVKQILDEMPKDEMITHKFLEDYGHLDFVWGLDAPSRVYEDLILFFGRYS